MPYDTDYLKDSLQEYGELIITLESGQTVELHKHDTSIITGDTPEVIVNLSDGTFAFTPDRIESLAYHTQSTADVGL